MSAHFRALLPPAYRTHGEPSAPLAWRAKGCAIALDGAPERRQSLSDPQGSPARKMGRPLERWATARAPRCDLRGGAIWPCWRCGQSEQAREQGAGGGLEGGHVIDAKVAVHLCGTWARR